MSALDEVFIMLEDVKDNMDRLKAILRSRFEEIKVYPDSIHYSHGSFFFLIWVGKEKKLVVYKDGEYYNRFTGDEVSSPSDKAKICSLSIDNSLLIREIFPFTAPSSRKGHDISIGLGDRLGLASAGHLRLFKDKKLFPILAQQSIRELNLTGRTYEDVLAAASWAVFQKGYTGGFGADGDHLKTDREVRMALECGFTMITLDCSEHIRNEVLSFSQEKISRLYAELEENKRKQLESKYLDRVFKIHEGTEIKYSTEEFERTVLVYLEAVRYTIDIYNRVIRNYHRSVDFEISIDETLTSTTPESHFLVASELIAGGVEIGSLAPRFCGEFQKGIDYKGDINQFDREFEIHAKIAEYFGYKVSVHSGSDKFKVFPVIGEKSRGRYHLKTAGTNWLEAVRIISKKEPQLYRRIHTFALSRLEAAKKYYHISANLENIPDITSLKDDELPQLIDQEDARQVLHITYGMILLAESQDGSKIFRDEIYSVLNKYENEYYNALEKHIGRHLALLGAI